MSKWCHQQHKWRVGLPFPLTTVPEQNKLLWPWGLLMGTSCVSLLFKLLHFGSLGGSNNPANNLNIPFLGGAGGCRLWHKLLSKHLQPCLRCCTCAFINPCMHHPCKAAPVCLPVPLVEVGCCLIWVQPVCRVSKTIAKNCLFSLFFSLKHSVCLVAGETMKHTHLPLLLIFFCWWFGWAGVVPWETTALQCMDNEGKKLLPFWSTGETKP